MKGNLPLNLEDREGDFTLGKQYVNNVQQKNLQLIRLVVNSMNVT